ncbi:MAG: permease [Candidatus Methylarchaceae archaeon HK02M2]|nr:permease [Candidatus Methylarchaceae archaeon HK02M2]
MNERFRILRTIFLLSFITIVLGLLIYSRIMAYSLAPTLKPVDFQGMELWRIPLAYIWDYLSHGWICLLFAFVAAGLVYEFTPKDIITRYMSSNKVTGYTIAAGIAPFLTVCSCTMVPLFAGVLYAGAGIGPAISFLLMAPAANILTIILTGEIISWEIAVVRIIASLVVAIVAGLLISKTAWGKKVENEHKVDVAQNTSIEIVKPPLDERLWSALKFGWYLGKKILPFFFFGLIAVSYVSAFVPEEVVSSYLTGVGGVLLASVIGGPLYTPTLVEIVLGKGLLDLGMSQAALLSWLMGQPYDIPNMIATSRIVKWKVVLSYAAIALAFSIMFGLLYGLMIGVL